jgi:DNA helicase-2/ATP-dependent DNA helicase PcrA
LDERLNTKHFLDFDNCYPGAKTVTLTQNYRSTPEILATANALIEKSENK